MVGIRLPLLRAWGAWVVGCVVLSGLVSAAEAPLSEELRLKRVEADLEWLDFKLGQLSTGEQWRDYFLLKELRQQIARGAEADVQTLARIQQRFHGTQEFFSRPETVALRDSLTGWSDSVAASDPRLLLASINLARQAPAVDPAALNAAKKRYENAVVQLENYLARSSDRGQQWKNYLVWDELLSATPDALHRVAKRLTAGHRERHTPYFVEAHNAAQHYAALQLQNEPTFAAELGQRLDALQQLVNRYPEVAAGAERSEVANQLGLQLLWLQDRGQAVPVVHQLRTRLSHPNFYWQASHYVVASGIEQTTVEPTIIQENILGTAVHGSGTTSVRTQVQLIPSPTFAMFDVLAFGTTHSRTVGHNSGATIQSTGVTNFSSRKRMFLTADGLSSWKATVDARSQSNPTCVDSGRGHGGFITRVADRVAWRRVYDQKGAADAESARIAARKAALRIDQQAQSNQVDANQRLETRIRRPLLNLGADPHQQYYSTSSEYLHSAILLAAGPDLGAPSAPPAIPQPGDYIVQSHETAAENYYKAKYARNRQGRLNEQQFRQDMLQFMSDAEFQKQFEPDPEEHWSIAFDQEQPIRVRFHDGGYSVQLVATEFQRYEEGAARRPPPQQARIAIGADYRFEVRGGSLVAVRQGEVKVDVLEGDPPVALRKSLQDRFSTTFAQEQIHDGLTLPGNFARAGKLQVAAVRSENGWLTIVWQRPSLAAR